MGSLFGWVVYFNAQRHFGKIRGDRQEFFVHRDDLVDVVSLERNQQVEFEPTEAPRGPRAVNVRVVELRRPQRRAVE
jgi:cold shock CspA family protein